MMYVRTTSMYLVTIVKLTCARTAGPAVSELHRLGAWPTAHALPCAYREALARRTFGPWESLARCGEVERSTKPTAGVSDKGSEVTIEVKRSRKSAQVL